jgi:hypothetical protein
VALATTTTARVWPCPFFHGISGNALATASGVDLCRWGMTDTI